MPSHRDESSTGSKKSRQGLLAKVRALRDRAATDGERAAAAAAAARIIEKYGLEDADADDAAEVEGLHDFRFRTARERKLLVQVTAAVIGASFEAWRHPDGRGLRVRATNLDAVEIEYRFEYYRALYAEEEEVLFVAFVHKHGLFSSDGDSDSDDDVDAEYLARLASMMGSLSDSELRRALPA